MDMEHKSVEVELKSLDEQGEGVLRFIRFHQEDKDADITLPGFVGRQKAVLLASHNWKSDYPPLGSGESFEADGATNFRFRLNMQDERAKSWYSWLKMDREAGLQQVSYGFSPYADAVEKWQKDGRTGRYLKPRQDGSPGAKLHEVSFVTVGSGNDTAIVDLKSTDALLSGVEESQRMEQPVVEVTDIAESSGQKLITAHTTPTSDRVWNITIQQQHIKETSGPAYYRNLYAIQDGGSETHKSSYRLLHHFLDEHGEPGPASVRACSLYISMLSKGLFPAREREGLYAHWAQHLKDAGMDVPELRSIDNYVYPFNEELKHVIYEWDSVLSQLENIHSIRAKRGMTLTQAQLDQFQAAYGRVEAFRVLLALKQLDRPTDEVLQHLSETARVEAMAQRAEEMRVKNSRQKEDTDRALVEAAVRHAQSKYTFLGGAS